VPLGAFCLAAGVPEDFDGDGASDSVFREHPPPGADGDASTVRVQFADTSSAELVFEVPRSLRKVASGDVDGDGRAELVWQYRDTGRLGFSELNGAGMTFAYATGSVAEIDVEVLGAGDFDGDGHDDVVRRSKASGEVGVLFLEIGGVRETVSLGATAPPHQKLAAIADYDADGRDEILWRNLDTGSLTLWKPVGESVAATALPPLFPPPLSFPPPTWQLLGEGDFDGDGHDDLFLRNPTVTDPDSPANGLIFSMHTGRPGDAVSLRGLWTPAFFDVLATGDFDGTGRSNLLVNYVPTQQPFFVEIEAGRVWLVSLLDFGNAVTRNRVTGKEHSVAFRSVQTLTSYRKSGDVPYWEAKGNPGLEPRWTPEQIVQQLEDFPGFYVDMGIRNGLPSGNKHHEEIGRIVNEVQALGSERGVDTSRLLLHWRNDIHRKHLPGDSICTSCDAGGSCQDFCTWEGTLVDAPFDPDWIMTVPRSEHQWSVDRIWNGDPVKDPWSEAGRDRWAGWVDRDAMAVVNTEAAVAALYGSVKDLDPAASRTDYAPHVSAVLMRLDDPAYRAWSLQKLLVDLRVMGVDPGEAAVVLYSYKPGWHAHYEGPDSLDPCAVADSHMWTGPQNPCDGTLEPPGGPFSRTPYGPGEFEIAINLMLREMRAGLTAAGYWDVAIATVERPDYRDEKWFILDSENREAPWLLGELVNSCDRTDLATAPDPARRGSCSDGLDDDGDGRVDFPDDPGCADAADATETALHLVCDDGLDNDRDGRVDARDPGCGDPTAPREDPACDDELDNDGDGRIDWDGGLLGGVPDPHCSGDPQRNMERKGCAGGRSSCPR
jgi:hypothetical protein